MLPTKSPSFVVVSNWLQWVAPETQTPDKFGVSSQAWFGVSFSLLQQIRQTAEAIALSAGATAQVIIEKQNPVTYNDPGLTERVLPILKRVLGADALKPLPPTTTAEDFSYYQQEIPGVFFFLGITPKGADPATAEPNHSPRFFADEGALIPGIRALANISVEFLRQLPHYPD